MTFEEYAKLHFATYAEFANTVRFILANAIDATPNLPRLRFIQYRAKDPARLKQRLEEAGKLETAQLEQDRKDLAGVRLIFYTNNDVQRFLSSHLVFDNFDVELDATKIHQPMPDNDGTRYRAIHYIVRLREDRTKLPEYAKFAGLRCEIQIQTILHHAWSETSHDIIYKGAIRSGFGTKAMAGIKKRFDDIMDKYLLPAGYEIQKAQSEYEQLQQGRELFDKDVVRLLAEARDNNERYELLTSLRDYTLPNYDDHAAAFNTLKRPLIETARAARKSVPIEVESPFGSWKGHEASNVIAVIVELFGLLRYTDITESFIALGEIFRDEDNADIRKNILDAVKHLAEYNIPAWQQVGPGVQRELIDYLAMLPLKDLDAIRPLALVVWREALESTMSGSRWKANSVVFQSGALPVSDTLRQIRSTAIEGLFACFKRAVNDSEKMEIIHALDAATRTPTQELYSNELLELTLQDATRIVEFMTDAVDQMSYEVRQHYEHELLYEYRRACSLAVGDDDKFKCKEPAAALAQAIEGFRDRANEDRQFVRYKVLVGYASVYPRHWTDESFDFSGAEAYRKEEAERYVDEITPGTEAEWFPFIERCASTKSQDLATFPTFGEFLVLFSKKKPEIADRCFARASKDLLAFLPALFAGLSQSAAKEIYDRNLEEQLAKGDHLLSLARHLRNNDTGQKALPGRILEKAIATGDDVAVMECLVLVMECFGSGQIDGEEELFRACVAYLTGKREARWVNGAWYLPRAEAFLAAISRENAEFLLSNLVFFPKVDYRLERILGQLAEHHLDLVWKFFGDRLNRKGANEDEGQYEDIPFQFHGLEEKLSRNPRLAIEVGRKWFAADDKLFRFKGGRLISCAFPNCTEEFAVELAELVSAGDEADTKFVLEIVQNYRGEESTHEVLKRIVTKYPDDRRNLSKIGISFDNTGVVSGEFGMVEALRAKKLMLEKWLEDDRPEVKKFAADHIRELGLRMAAEQLRAEQDVEMRRRDFPDDDGSKD